MTTPAPQPPTPDLEAQIRAAEQRVIAADRDWQRHTEALVVSARGQAGRAVTLGGLGLASTVAGALLLRWRLSSRSKAREKLLVRALNKIGWPRDVAPKPVAVPPVMRSTVLMSVLATVGTLLGAAARTGLKLPAKPGVASVVMSVVMPMLKRWLSSRTQAAPVRPAVPVRPMLPVPASMPMQPVAPVSPVSPRQPPGPRPG